MASKWPPVKNSALTFRCVLFAQDDNQILANPTIAAGDWKVSTDGAAFANLATLPDVDPDSSVQVLVSLSAGEMNGDEIMITAIDAAGDEWHSAAWVIHTVGQTFDTMDTNIDSILADTGTDGVVLANDAITAAKFDESTAFPLKSADAGATAVARTGADSDTLETLSDQLDGAALETTAQSILTDTGTTIPATLATIGGYIDTEVAAVLAAVDTEVAAILEDTGTTIPAQITALNNLSAADVNAQVVDVLRTDTLPDSYSADGAQPTIAQALLEIRQFLLEREVSSTTVTVNKPDGTTEAFTLTLDDASNPTSITRAS